MSNDNVITLFPTKDKKFLNVEKLNDVDIQRFLDILDESVYTFNELSVMEKYSLYKTLVEFTRTSMGIYMKGEKV